MNNPAKKLSMELLVVITSLSDTEKLDRLFQKAGFPLQYRFRGEGTASSEVMDLLGLKSIDKAVTICALPKLAVSRALRALSDELGLYKPGHGIAFCVPLSGISSPALKRLEGHFSEEMTNQFENEVNQMIEACEYCLVMAAVEQGYSEEVMDTAKECGVTGGTVIHARRLGMEEKMKFWGISVQGERDIIAILVRRDKKLDLMHAIGEKYGMQSKAHGLIFSLPVDNIAGLSHAPGI